mmetsp:Transcript_38663/g.42788  ORF Transcript_38663/g.42788 Transcript_38663/m.42788 type:complete len:767 (-) Transcript_38663:41-2341(-)
MPSRDSQVLEKKEHIDIQNLSMTDAALDLSLLRKKLLRKAISLVHCLQKERGTSCAFSVKSSLFEQTLSHAHLRTDAAIRLWQRCDLDSLNLPLLEILSKIRLKVRAGIENESRKNNSYHEIIVMFNNLIGTVIHSSLLNSVKKILEPENQIEKKKREKYLSCGIDDNMISFSKAKGGLRKKKQCASFREQISPNQQKLTETGGVTFTEKSRTISLLKMLECFVRLKESTGIERAILCCMGATGQVDRRLFNDLVLEVENQVILISELQDMNSLDGNLLHLIRESVDLPAPMKQLQEEILNKFNLEGFRLDMTMQAVFNLITLYMDRLHSLELLIVEELEYSLIEDSHLFQTSSGNEKEKLDSFSNNLCGFMGLLATNDMKEISAEEIKANLLKFLSTNNLNTAEEIASPIDENVQSPSPALHPSLMSVNVQHSDCRPEPSAWDIDLYEIHFRKRIGRGTAGTTYLADWSGKEVAVKVAASTEMGLDGWKAEVSSLRKLHHPNIIRLLGSVYNEIHLTHCLVLEYCSGGDLSKALSRPTHSSFFFKIALDIAQGLCYLHSRNIIHRDIKPPNVLLDGNISTGAFSAKVTDFGLATIEGGAEKTSETGTYRWMAPEVIRHQPYSQKADCYSYGILIWQLLTREDPFALHSPLEAAGKVALEAARPKFPRKTPNTVQKLIENCWAEDPERRYSFELICEKLVHGLDLSPEEERWIQAPYGHSVYEEDKYTEDHKEQESSIDSGKMFIKCKDKKASGLKKFFKFNSKRR